MCSSGFSALSYSPRSHLGLQVSWGNHVTPLPALPAPVLCPGPSVSPAGPLSVHLRHQTAFFLLSNPDLSLQLKPICLSYPLGIFWKKCSFFSFAHPKASTNHTACPSLCFSSSPRLILTNYFTPAPETFLAHQSTATYFPLRKLRMEIQLPSYPFVACMFWISSNLSRPFLSAKLLPPRAVVLLSLVSPGAT